MAAQLPDLNEGHLKLLLEDTGYPDIANFIKKALDSVIPRKAIDFRTNVAKAITQCLQSNGVPMFRTKYNKQPFAMNSVLMVCYLGRLKGTFFKDVPPEDMQLLRSKGDGYTLMLRKYGQYAASGPAGAVSIGGAAVYTGQAVVSEAIDELEYFLSGQQVDFEEFSKAYMREFPGTLITEGPFYKSGKMGRTYIAKFRAEKPSALEQKVTDIMAKMKEMLADEEKAVPEYGKLADDIEKVLELVPKTEHEKYRYLYAAMKGIQANQIDETKHRDKLRNLIPAMEELRKTVELERITGRSHVLKPLERV